MNTPIQHWATTRPRSFLWALFALFVLLRFPTMLASPTFYAEEGVVYFRYALSHGVWDTLTARHVGYYALFPNLAGLLAASVPLSLSPFVVTGLGLLGPCACAYLLIELASSVRTRAGALAIMVFTLTMRTEWGSTIHTQFWLACAMMLMLASSSPRTRAACSVHAVIVAMAASTGVVSALLAPFFGLAFVQRREPRFLLIAGVLGTALLAQAVTGASRETTWRVGEFLCVLLMKLAVTPFLGRLSDPMGRALFAQSGALWVVLSVGALVLAWGAFVVSQAKRRFRLVAMASLLVGSASLYFALPPYDGLVLTMPGSRYAFPGVVPVCIALWVSRDAQSTRARHFVRVLVMAALVGGVVTGVKLAVDRVRSPSSFVDDAARFARDRGVTLALHQPRCRVSVNASEQRVGFDVSAPERAESGDIVLTITPGQHDRDVALGVFIVAGARGEPPRTMLSAEGWREHDVVYYGDGHWTSAGLCYGIAGVPQLPAYAGFRGASYGLVLSRAQVEALPSDVDEVYVGYGRDYADALAKGTFRKLGREALLGGR